MVFQMASYVFAVIFVLGFGSSHGCGFKDISKCMDMLTELEFNEVQDVCDAVTSAKTCLQTLLDGGTCSAEINEAIETNMGTINKIESACGKVTGHETVECTLNGVLSCVKPIKAAESEPSNKELVCNIMSVIKPCLGHIEDKCSRKATVKMAVKAANNAIKAFDVIC